MKKLMTLAIALPLFGASGQLLADDHKSLICHKGKEAYVANAAVPAHIKHGDNEGECEDGEGGGGADAWKTVVMMRCEGITGAEPPENNTVEIVSASSSVPTYQIVPGLDCAVTLSRLLNIGYSIRSITSGSADSGSGISLYTDYLLLGKEDSQ